MKLKDFLGKISGPFAFKLTFYALLLQKKCFKLRYLLAVEHDQRNVLQTMEFPASWPAETFHRGQVPPEPPDSPGFGREHPCSDFFPPKTKAIAVPRHNPSMKRTQKYLWRPSGLGLAGERKKYSNRLKGILKAAEDTRHTSMVMGSLGN